MYTLSYISPLKLNPLTSSRLKPPLYTPAPPSPLSLLFIVFIFTKPPAAPINPSALFVFWNNI